MNKKYLKYKERKKEEKDKNKKFIDLYEESENFSVNSCSTTNSKNKNCKIADSSDKKILQMQFNNMMPSSFPCISPSLLNTKFDTPLSFKNNTILNKDIFSDLNQGSQEKIVYSSPKQNESTNELNSFLNHLKIFKKDIGKLFQNLNNGNVDLKHHQKIFEYISFLFINSKFLNLKDSQNKTLCSNLLSNPIENNVDNHPLINNHQSKYIFVFYSLNFRSKRFQLGEERAFNKIIKYQN